MNMFQEIVKEKYLKKLKELLPQNLTPFVESLMQLGNLYNTVCRKNIYEKDKEKDLETPMETQLGLNTEECDKAIKSFSL